MRTQQAQGTRLRKKLQKIANYQVTEQELLEKVDLKKLYGELKAQNKYTKDYSTFKKDFFPDMTVGIKLVRAWNRLKAIFNLK